MAKKRRYYRKAKHSKCPEPFNTLIDIAGAITLGAYAKHRIKKDYQNGDGDSSAKAAMMVLGSGALHRGSKGIISTGGLIGLSKGIDEINRGKNEGVYNNPQYKQVDKNISINKKVSKKYIWRKYCEDGTEYGVNQSDFENADDYEEALKKSKELTAKKDKIEITEELPEENERKKNHVWRKYCSDGSKYGISPNDYNNADDYEEAIKEAKRQNQNQK